MAFRAGTHTVGGDRGTLQVRTYREGLAKMAGHDLVINVGVWEAAAEVRDDGTLSAVRLNADPHSLQVREGLRGVRPLTDKDRAGIGKIIDEQILGGHPIAFRSTGVEPGHGGLTVRGELELAGTKRPASFEARGGRGRPGGRDAARDPERVGNQALSGDDGRPQGARHHRSRSRRAATVGLSRRSCFARLRDAPAPAFKPPVRRRSWPSTDGRRQCQCRWAG